MSRTSTASRRSICACRSSRSRRRWRERWSLRRGWRRPRRISATLARRSRPGSGADTRRTLTLEARAGRLARDGEALRLELRPALRPAWKEADERVADLHLGVVHRDVEELCERERLRFGVVREEVELAQAEVVRLGQQLVQPFPRRVDLQAVTRVRGDERAPPSVLLHAEVLRLRAREDGEELLLVEREAEVVDARELPLARLDDDVDRPALELREAELEPAAVEMLPREAGLVGDRLLADAPVAGDQVEAELADVAALEVPDLRRDEVVVEDLHRVFLSASVGAYAGRSRR